MTPDQVPRGDPRDLSRQLLALSHEISELALKCGAEGGSVEAYEALEQARKKFEELSSYILRPTPSV